MRIRGRLTTRLTLVVVAALGLLGTGFAVSKYFDFKGSGGSLSPYNVGFYDLNPGFELPTAARLYLVNPTPLTLTAYVAMFDDSERALACTKPTLSPNDLVIVDITQFVNSANNPGLQGVVKIVTFNSARPGVAVQAGVKGWIRHEAFHVQIIPGTFNATTNQTTPNRTVRTSQPLVESGLKEVPDEVLFFPGRHRRHGMATELSLIVGACP